MGTVASCCALLATVRRDLSAVPLRENPLQRAPVHVQPARCFRDVAVAHLVDALDVLPAHAVGRHRIRRQLGLVSAGREQRGDDVVGVRRLREIIDRAHLHRGHRGGDVAIAGQHDGAGFGALLLQRRDDIEAIAVAEPQIDHCEGGCGLADLGETVRDAVTRRHRKAARFHGARQALQKRLVVLHDEKRAVGLFVEFGDGGQDFVLSPAHLHMASQSGGAKALNTRPRIVESPLRCDARSRSILLFLRKSR